MPMAELIGRRGFLHRTAPRPRRRRDQSLPIRSAPHRVAYHGLDGGSDAGACPRVRTTAPTLIGERRLLRRALFLIGLGTTAWHSRS
jgi:hypothetical protein